MTTITIDRATVEQALEALESVYGDSCDALHALRAALAQKHDPVAHSGWVLREVLFDNGEPIGHREPQHSPAALAQEPASDFERGFQRGWQRAMRDRDRDALVRAKVEAELAATVERLAELSPIRELHAQQAEPVRFLIEGNEFCGPPPAPYSTWGDALDSMIGARAIQGLRISSLAQQAKNPGAEPC